MGLGAISCKGSYEETGNTVFGEGTRTSSDFDGEDILMGATLALSGAMIGAMLTSICYEWDEKPQYPVKRVTIEGFEKVAFGHSADAVRRRSKSLANPS